MAIEALCMRRRNAEASRKFKVQIMFDFVFELGVDIAIGVALLAFVKSLIAI